MDEPRPVSAVLLILLAPDFSLCGTIMVMYSPARISASDLRKLGNRRKSASDLRKSRLGDSLKADCPIGRFALSWSHYLVLLRIADVEKREFYERSAVEGSWKLEQLARQIETFSYEGQAVCGRDDASRLREEPGVRQAVHGGNSAEGDLPAHHAAGAGEVRKREDPRLGREAGGCEMSLVKKDWHQNVMAALELLHKKGGRK